MAQTILIKRSNSTATPASLLEGELAYSTVSKNLFIGTNGGANIDIIAGLGQASSTAPLMDGTATVGTGTTWARADHIHPSDTTKANLAGPTTFTGVTSGATAAVDTNTTQLATTAFVVAQASSSTPLMDGTATIGTSLRYSRQDHIHATDTSRASLVANTFTGKQILMSPSTSSASLLLPNGSADPSSPATGDMWANGGIIKWYNGTANRTIAFLDSNITGTATNVSGIVAVVNGGTGVTTSTGTGSVVLSNSPSLVTPNIGVATGTSFNSITALADTLPVMDGTATIGVSTKVARQDHIHASDTTKVSTSLLGANSGVATLDSSGKLTTSQIPTSLVGGLNYQGVWNASTNSPTLANGTGTKGYYYKVSVAGNTTIDTNTNWSLGDLIVFDGTTWDKVEGGSPDVVSVAGKVGTVTLVAGDVGLGNVTNVAQLAYTQTLAVTGDATAPATALNTGTIALTLANSGVTAGTYNNSATTVTPFTVDAKGRITSVGTAVALAPTWSSITSTPTTISGYGITDALSSSSTIDGGTF
jgi:hypothetical protein